MRMKNGFTIIELLVVVAIIGILASMVITNVSSAREKARDARRKSDLKSIQNALELYANNNNDNYPVTLNNLIPDYIASMPKDPSTKTDYGFDHFKYSQADTDCKSGTENNSQYRILATLERKTDIDLPYCNGTKYDKYIVGN